MFMELVSPMTTTEPAKRRRWKSTSPAMAREWSSAKLRWVKVLEKSM